MFRGEVRGYSPVLWRYRRDWSLSTRRIRLSSSCVSGRLTFWRLGPPLSPSPSPGPIGFVSRCLRSSCVMIGSLSIFCRSFRLVGSLLVGNRCLIPNEVDFSWSCQPQLFLCSFGTVGTSASVSLLAIATYRDETRQVHFIVYHRMAAESNSVSAPMSARFQTAPTGGSLTAVGALSKRAHVCAVSNRAYR